MGQAIEQNVRCGMARTRRAVVADVGRPATRAVDSAAEARRVAPHDGGEVAGGSRPARARKVKFLDLRAALGGMR